MVDDRSVKLAVSLTGCMKCGFWLMLTNCISITVTLNHQALRQCLTRRKTHSMGQHYNQQGRKERRV